MIRFFVAVFLTAFLATGLEAQAQSNVLTAEALDVRNRLENEIQKNLQQLLATRLDPKTFTIAVRARVTVMPPPQPEEKKAPETLPAGMDLGTIDVRELLESYEKQIEELKVRQEAKKDQPVQYQLRSLEVAVGLSETYGDEYAATFTTWLKNKMRTDYGSVATANVNKVKFTDLEKDKAPKEPETPVPPPFDPLRLIPLAAALLVALALVLLGRFLKSGLSQVASAQKTLSLEQKGEWALGSSTFEPEEEKDVTDTGAVERFNPHEPDRLVSKIAFVCLELNERLNDLVRVWIDAGDEGFVKTALLIDTMINAREKIMSSTGALPPLRIPIDEEIVKLREENLAEAYRQVATMEEQAKTELLEEIYWDLISCRTLGLQSLRRPFDFLQGLPKENVQELLSVQKEDAQALALVYLPGELQNEILNEYDERKKTDVIKNMLVQSQISQRQIWDIDTSVKVATINSSAQPEEKLVNLFPRTVEVLQSLSAVDEIKILRQVAPQLPENGLTVKQQYTTLAFIDEWKSDYVRKLAQTATGDELVTLIRQVSASQKVILDQCSPKVRMIIEDDLKLSSIQDVAVTNTKLASLKAKWNKIVVSENLPMTRVLENRRSEGISNAA